jgi:hypothetical protein
MGALAIELPAAHADRLGFWIGCHPLDGGNTHGESSIEE